jgi:hypothetical protein
MVAHRSSNGQFTIVCELIVAVVRHQLLTILPNLPSTGGFRYCRAKLKGT